jgi:hypothetical protein
MGAGEDFDDQDANPAGCCPGTVAVGLHVVPAPDCGGGQCLIDSMDPRCANSDPTSTTQVCILCGDGICRPDENSCTCPHDCPWPDGGALADARVPETD